ncbi:hypothetical protein [Collimonas fungivorans]|uniref:Uncharacterized protein n=1 Tax=Collimonas fungivorans (strain Ter331) TaxID=1005048 RepID=G0AAI9_COLFT|nr:hypothetical protein [Collimonas fungivorans]AEK63203.1 hypothetical protein CFU_3379 [Collimonas fungivorans Ter331]
MNNDIQTTLLDEHAVDIFSKAMKKKLQFKREQGFGGWNDITKCSGDRLAELLLAAVAKGDPVDVANFAMMLFCRHESHDALKDACAAALTAPQRNPWQELRNAISPEMDAAFDRAAGVHTMPIAKLESAAQAISDGRNEDAARLITLATSQTLPFQQRVQPWMMECFGSEIAADRKERNHRFFEEATELIQACEMTRSEAHQLVDYVYARPVGDARQEVGGVMVTLAALCLAQDMDMHAAGEIELVRIWTKVDQIRAKQAAKPRHSPLPAVPADPVLSDEDAEHMQAARKSLSELREAVELCGLALGRGEGFDEAWQIVQEKEIAAYQWLLADVPRVPARQHAIALLAKVRP